MTDRQSILLLLSAFGVVLPPETKLPFVVLKKRLEQTLNASQQLSPIIKSTPFNPLRYPRWSVRDKKKYPGSLAAAWMKTNIMENVMGGVISMENLPSDSDPFLGLRFTLLLIVKRWEVGDRTFILERRDCHAPLTTMILKIVEVFTAEDGTPIITFLHQQTEQVEGIPRAKFTGTMATWFECRSERERKSDNILSTTLPVSFLLRQLLLNNAGQLSTQYNPQRHDSEKFFCLSFALPVAPLNMEDIGRLSQKLGCSVCGNKNASQCSQCMEVFYCSKDCQRVDWKEHKSACKSIKDGRWENITVSPLLMPGRYQSGFNRFDSSFNASVLGPEEDEKPPADIHGNKIFLIKMQSGPGILIYDYTRSFQVFMRRDQNPGIFQETDHIIHTTGIMGGKIYRWAKRVGDFQLSVCLDKVPQTPGW